MPLRRIEPNCDCESSGNPRVRRSRRASMALQGVVLLVGCAPFADMSCAQGLPGASFYVNAGTVSSSGDFGSAPTSVTSGACVTGSGACATTAAASPSADVSVSGGAGDGGLSGSSATADFPFEVEGPTTQLVPVVIVGSATSSVSASGLAASATEAYSIIQVYNPEGSAVVDFYSCAQLNYNIACGGGGGTLIQIFDIEANTFFATLELTASGGATGGAKSTGFYSADADPILSIEPSFLAANPGYSLVFGQGYQPAAATPEPSTWVMLIVGFMGLGFAGWRGRAAAP
jgi:hypothetical protein